MPDEIGSDASRQRLLVGTGCIENVPQAVWEYEVSGKRVLTQWFSYRKRNRERPIIGDRRPPSPLGEIQPDHWLAEVQATIAKVARDWAENGVPPKRFITAEDLRAAADPDPPAGRRKTRRQERADAPTLFRDEDFDPEPQPPAADEPR